MAGDAGFDGIAIGAGCSQADVPALTAAALSAGLLVPLVAAPLGEGPLAPGRRLPHLASLTDSDERRAAVAMFTATVEMAVPLGVRLFTVSLGQVALRAEPADVGRRFARRELDEDEPGAPLWAGTVGERLSLSDLIVDACRYALDRVVPIAERRDAVVALEIAGDPWAMPSPREALALVGEYRTGPVGVVWDQGRMQALRALGIGPSAERRKGLRAVTRAWRANEAVGMEAGYLPGLGDPDATDQEGGAAEDQQARQNRGKQGAPDGVTASVDGIPPGVPLVVTGRPDSRADEVAQARALVLRG